MEGKEACWVPGTDHASIATEAKVVAMLKEKGIEKKDISREEFLAHAFEWKEKSSSSKPPFLKINIFRTKKMLGKDMMGEGRIDISQIIQENRPLSILIHQSLQMKLSL